MSFSSDSAEAGDFPTAIVKSGFTQKKLRKVNGTSICLTLVG